MRARSEPRPAPSRGPRSDLKAILAVSIVGLYIFTTLALLAWYMAQQDVGGFFSNMNKANFLLGPVGFVVGHYFRDSAARS